MSGYARQLDAARELLTQLCTAAGKPDGVAWLADRTRAIAAGDEQVAVAFPAASRKLGRTALGAEERGELEVYLAGSSYKFPLAAWRVDDAGRALLLVAEATRTPDAAIETARELFFHGDARERVGVLRSLALVGDSSAAVDVILDGLRVSQGEIFEATICDNAYASAYLEDHDFRKAVLKCVFVGLPIGRILGVADRADPTLCSALLDYVTEREAASRSVPPELWPMIALHPPAGFAAKLLGYLEHPDARHRGAAVAGIGRLIESGDDRLLSFLSSRAGREADDTVRGVLRAELLSRQGSH